MGDLDTNINATIETLNKQVELLTGIKPTISVMVNKAGELEEVASMVADLSYNLKQSATIHRQQDSTYWFKIGPNITVFM